MAHLYGGNYGTEVVGESHYFGTLAKCFKASKIDKSGKRSYLIVQLVCENNNKYDKNAVAVVSDFGVVGHLSRDDAVDYRELYAEATHTTDAVIVTRDGTKFGVWLDVDLYDDDFAKSIINESMAQDKQPVTTQPTAPTEPSQSQPTAPPFVVQEKRWQDMNKGERIFSVISVLFCIGLIYLAYKILAFIFGLIF